MRVVLAVAGVLYVLHQDIWFWRTPEPLVFGFLPIGMFYHAVYTALIAVVLALLARSHWPTHHEDPDPKP
jgi:hypothetical protein